MKKATEEKAFYGWEVARFHLNFPNGNYLSTIWGAGTYSDEHDRDIFGTLREDRPVFNSNTVEVMFTCPDKLKKKILKKYNDGDSDPIGYLTLPQWIEIVNLLNK